MVFYYFLPDLPQLEPTNCMILVTQIIGPDSIPPREDEGLVQASKLYTVVVYNLWTSWNLKVAPHGHSMCSDPGGL